MTFVDNHQMPLSVNNQMPLSTAGASINNTIHLCLQNNTHVNKHITPLSTNTKCLSTTRKHIYQKSDTTSTNSRQQTNKSADKQNKSQIAQLSTVKLHTRLTNNMDQQFHIRQHFIHQACPVKLFLCLCHIQG